MVRATSRPKSLSSSPQNVHEVDVWPGWRRAFSAPIRFVKEGQIVKHIGGPVDVPVDESLLGHFVGALEDPVDDNIGLCCPVLPRW